MTGAAGRKYNLLALVAVVAGLVMALALGQVFGLKIGHTLGLFAVRPVRGAEPPFRIIGGEKLDQAFLAGLPVAPGMTVALYAESAQPANSSSPVFDPRQLIAPDRIDEPGLDALPAQPAAGQVALEMLKGRTHGSLLERSSMLRTPTAFLPHYFLCPCACASGLVSMCAQPALLAQYSQARQVSVE